MDSLAATGVTFTNAFVNTLGTPPSHATMLTSLYQETHRVHFSDREGFAQYRIPDELVLLQEHLQRSGYTTVGATGGGYLSGEFGYSRGFTAFDATPKKNHVGARKLLRLVKQHADTEKPIFAFLHTYYIHSPYSAPPEYRRMWGQFKGRIEPSSQNLLAINAGEIQATEEDVDYITAMYDAGIRFTDDALRRLFANLDQLGFFDSYLVVITADHGEELGERGGFAHRPMLYDDLLHVPLILEGTMVPRGKRDQALAGTVDIAPTILRAAGIETNALLEGRDLLSSDAPDAVFAQYQEQRYSIRTKDYRLIVNQEPRVVELFDQRSDPRQQENAAARFPEKAQTLERQLWRWRRGRPSLRSLTTPDVQLDSDTHERLRELGYVE